MPKNTQRLNVSGSKPRVTPPVVRVVEEPELMNDQEDDPDVYYISRGESHIDVANWIYEFINLSIPMQRMCGPDEIGGPSCNKEGRFCMYKILFL